MRALRLIKEEQLEMSDVAEPEAPRAGEARVRVRALALNHIDLFGLRGMAFAKRSLPLIVGVECAATVIDTEFGVSHVKPGDNVVIYPGAFCGHCRACRESRENLCESVGGVMGFHVDGMARERLVVPANRLIAVPPGIDLVEAACTTVTFGTVQHMLFDNAKLERGETILIHAGGSGIGTTAIKMAKAAGATVIATAGGPEKAAKVKALGADHAIDYRAERFEGVVRRLTGRKGVDVVFEHVGPDTWAGSLLSLKRGGRLVTCGSTSGILAETNLYSLFQQQLRIIGSFGSTLRNCRDSLAKMFAGLKPVIDSVIKLEDFPQAIERLRRRDVFGKIVARLD